MTGIALAWLIARIAIGLIFAFGAILLWQIEEPILFSTPSIDDPRAGEGEEVAEFEGHFQSHREGK